MAGEYNGHRHRGGSSSSSGGSSSSFKQFGRRYQQQQFKQFGRRYRQQQFKQFGGTTSSSGSSGSSSSSSGGSTGSGNGAYIRQFNSVTSPGQPGNPQELSLGVALSQPALAGSAILVFTTESNGGNPGLPITVSDAAGNPYSLVDQVDDKSNAAWQSLFSFGAYNISAGTVSVTVKFKELEWQGVLVVEVAGVTSLPFDYACKKSAGLPWYRGEYRDQRNHDRRFAPRHRRCAQHGELGLQGSTGARHRIHDRGVRVELEWRREHSQGTVSAARISALRESRRRRGDIYRADLGRRLQFAGPDVRGLGQARIRAYGAMPAAARSSASISMRFICIIASKARFARRGSSPSTLMSWRGTICQETPNRSFTQPHCSAAGTADSALL